jgi:hypothetical protein
MTHESLATLSGAGLVTSHESTPDSKLSRAESAAYEMAAVLRSVRVTAAAKSRSDAAGLVTGTGMPGRVPARSLRLRVTTESRSP